MDKIIDKIVSTLDYDPKATKETNILKNLGFLLAALAALIFLVLFILIATLFINRFPRYQPFLIFLDSRNSMML